MNKYINKLKESAELRNKMTLSIEGGSYYDPVAHTPTPNPAYSYTYMTDSDAEDDEDDTFIDVSSKELLWNGWDSEYKIVSVLVKKFVNNRLIGEKNVIAIYREKFEEYFIIPKKLAKKEGLM